VLQVCVFSAAADTVGYTAVFIGFLLELVTVAGPSKLRVSEEAVAESILFLGVRRSWGSGGLCSCYGLSLECQRGTSQSSLISVFSVLIQLLELACVLCLVRWTVLVSCRPLY
jgi:hypothetical protein